MSTYIFSQLDNFQTAKLLSAYSLIDHFLLPEHLISWVQRKPLAHCQ